MGLGRLEISVAKSSRSVLLFCCLYSRYLTIALTVAVITFSLLLASEDSRVSLNLSLPVSPASENCLLGKDRS